MKSSEISAILQNCADCDLFKTVCVCPFDCLPTYVQVHERPALFVVNCDPSYLPGSHWTVIYIPHRDYFNHRPPFFFDPLGSHPAFYSNTIHKFLKRHALKSYGQVYHWNSQQIQPENSNSCGYYCTYFALELSASMLNPQSLVEYMFSLSEDLIVFFVLMKWTNVLFSIQHVV